MAHANVLYSLEHDMSRNTEHIMLIHTFNVFSGDKCNIDNIFHLLKQYYVNYHQHKSILYCTEYKKAEQSNCDRIQMRILLVNCSSCALPVLHLQVDFSRKYI